MPMAVKSLAKELRTCSLSCALACLIWACDHQGNAQSGPAFHITSDLADAACASSGAITLKLIQREDETDFILAAALAFAYGKEVPKSDAAALLLFQYGAALGDERAQYALGVMHQYGRGTAKDFKKAAQS